MRARRRGRRGVSMAGRVLAPVQGVSMAGSTGAACQGVSMARRARWRVAGLAAMAAALMGWSPLSASAQEPAITFSSDLPRTLVFIAEEGRADIATREMTAFLREAGFPLVDPALAQTAAQQELVRRALEGDEQAAVELGRDFGAQVLLLGTSEFASREDPVLQMITGTSQVAVRALRLDNGQVLADEVADGREPGATDQDAETAAIQEAMSNLLASSLVGELINDWERTPWREASYWAPDPGSVPDAVGTPAERGEAPGLAILLADVRPASGGTTRGLGVVKKGDRSSSLFNPVRLEGVVVGETRGVSVDGKPANLEPLEAGEAARLGLTGTRAQRFWAETTLPMSQDSVRVVAQGTGGAVTETVAAPRVDERWAVIIGVGEYASADIPDLAYARADAEAVRDFLTSEAAGPFEEDHVLFLADGEATGAAMREALFVFLQQADWDDLVFIYYAGHGAPDPNRPDNLYLLPADADLDALAATGFPMWDVKTALRRQIAAERVIVVADACHSAGTADGETVGDTGANPVAGSFSELFTPSRRLMMTAADTNEFSLEDARWGGHGVFTHFLLQGLEGAGDENGDGIVTFSELYGFVSEQVVTATQGRQNPQRAGLGDIPLAVVEGPAPEGGAPMERPAPEGAAPHPAPPNGPGAPGSSRR